MSNHFTFEQFIQLITDELGVEKNNLSRTTSFINDLGIDSLSLINFIIKTEKSYQIKLNNEKGFFITNLGDAYDIFIDALEG